MQAKERKRKRALSSSSNLSCMEWREEDAEATHETFIFTSPIFLPPPPPHYILPLPRIFLHIRCEIHQKNPQFFWAIFHRCLRGWFPRKMMSWLFQKCWISYPGTTTKKPFSFLPPLFDTNDVCLVGPLFSSSSPLVVVPAFGFLVEEEACIWLEGEEPRKKRERIRKERGKEKNGCTHEIGPRIQLPFSLWSYFFHFLMWERKKSKDISEAEKKKGQIRFFSLTRKGKMEKTNGWWSHDTSPKRRYFFFPLFET